MNEPAEDLDAEHIVRYSAERALGSRPLLRSITVMLWSAFLGACVLLVAWLALIPEPPVPLSLGRLSLIFMALWALALVPAGSAMLLSDTHRDARGRSDR